MTKTSQPISTSTADRALLVGLGWKRAPRFPGMPAGEQGRRIAPGTCRASTQCRCGNRGYGFSGARIGGSGNARGTRQAGRNSRRGHRAQSAAHYFRQQPFSDAAAQHRSCHGAPRDRPHAADSGYFGEHARSREGQLQVELAQTNYMLPRLTRERRFDVLVSAGGKSGGGGCRRSGGGAGRRRRSRTWRKEIGTDRRRIRDRVGKIQNSMRTSANSAPAAGSPQRRAARDDCTRRLHQRRQIDFVQCAQPRRSAGVSRACSPRSIRPFARSACPPIAACRWWTPWDLSAICQRAC